jgi:alkylated DNA repair dioxygenase AlkB
MKQGKLFVVVPQLPAGMLYVPEFISREEEASLLAEIAELPLHEAQYKEFTAKRRIMSYGASYDFSSNELIPAGEIPPFLMPLRERIAEWVRVPASLFTHALIAEYKTGTQLGWHRDVPDFEFIVGVSLAGHARMRLRRYPPKKGRDVETLSIDLEPRSAYVMRGEARWGWQHSIPPTKTLRYSITFRTRRIA